MQKIQKMTKTCQLYDVIMTSRQQLKKFLVPDLGFSLNFLHRILFKELFPDWKIQEKWISITLRGRTCIVLLKADFNQKLDYKQEYI